jgi:hypothetical protein
VRVEGWESRLVEMMMDAMKAPFSWGTHDCALFACDAVVALTGTDPGAEYRGTYFSEREAAVVLMRDGGLMTIVERMAWRYRWPVVHQLHAQRGDVAIAELRGQDTLGVCIGTGFVFAQQPTGLLSVRLDSPAIRATWRVR